MFHSAYHILYSINIEFVTASVFKEINIPANLWGKFYTKGKMPITIQNLWDEVIDWVKNSEYELDTNYDFECYSEGDTNSDDYESGIWVALKLKN